MTEIEMMRGPALVDFFVPGIPATAGSKRGFVYTPKGGGRPKAGLADSTGQKGKNWRAVVQLAAQDHRPAVPLDGPLYLDVTFAMPRPKGHFRTDGTLRPGRADALPAVKPDSTKMLRAIEDACTKLLWRDDALVCRTLVHKVYAPVGASPGARIRVGRLLVRGLL